MVLRVLENRLVPAHWRGQAPPAVVQGHIYSELEVRPVQAAVGKDAALQEGGERQPTRAEAARNRKKMTNEERDALAAYRTREGAPPSGERQYAHYTRLRELDSALPWLKRWMFKDTKAPPGPKSSPRSSRQK